MILTPDPNPESDFQPFLESDPPLKFTQKSKDPAKFQNFGLNIVNFGLNLDQTPGLELILVWIGIWHQIKTNSES